MKAATVLKVVLAVAVAAGLSACNRHEADMGPAQKAGKAVDGAVNSAGEKVSRELHDKLDRADQVGKDVAKSAQETRDKISEATDDASKGLNKATEQVGKKVERAGEKIQEAAH